MANEFIEQFYRGVADADAKIAQRKKDKEDALKAQRDAEDRALNLKRQERQLGLDKINLQILQRNLALQGAQSQTGQPGGSMPTLIPGRVQGIGAPEEPTPTAPQLQGPGAGLGEINKLLMKHRGSAPVQLDGQRTFDLPTKFRGPDVPDEYHAPVNIPGVDFGELGLGSVPSSTFSAPTQAGQELAKMREEQRKNVLPPYEIVGGSIYVPETGEFKQPPRSQTPDNSITPFEVWRQQNPNAPVTEWLKVSNPPSTAQPKASDYEWIVRDGAPLQIPKGTASPGDRPYSAAAAAGSLGASPYAAERAFRTIQSVNELMGKVSSWTTGFGSLLAAVPTSAARNFAAELQTLKASIAFNELTAMREASKTGGALGNVSDKEMKLLEAALGALDTGQSPANIKSQLEKIKASIERWQAASKQAGVDVGGGGGGAGGGGKGDPLGIR